MHLSSSSFFLCFFFFFHCHLSSLCRAFTHLPFKPFPSVSPSLNRVPQSWHHWSVGPDHSVLGAGAIEHTFFLIFPLAIRRPGRRVRGWLGGRIITFSNLKGPEIWSNTTPSFYRWGNILRGGGRGCVRAKNVGEQVPGQTGSQNSRPCSRISSPTGTQGLLPQVLSPSKTFSHLGNQSEQDMTSPQHRRANVHAWDSVPKLLVNKNERRSHPEYLMMTHPLVTPQCSPVIMTERMSYQLTTPVPTEDNKEQEICRAWEGVWGQCLRWPFLGKPSTNSVIAQLETFLIKLKVFKK